jgi:hypothetical protein
MCYQQSLHPDIIIYGCDGGELKVLAMTNEHIAREAAEYDSTTSLLYF